MQDAKGTVSRKHVALISDKRLAQEIARAWQGMRNADTEEIHNQWSARYETLVMEQDNRH